MKRTLILALLLVSNLCPAQSFNAGFPTTVNYYQELPYREVNGKIIIEVGIAGSMHQFLLDTGAPTIISDDLAKRLRDTAVITASISDAYAHVDTAKIATVATIRLGEIRFKNTPALIGLPGIVKCLGVEGIIGSNLLRSSIVQFNSSKKILIITDDAGRLHLDNKNSVPMNINLDAQSSPFIKIKVGGKVNTQLLFDTGDEEIMEISDNYMSVFKKYNTYTVLASGYGANGYSSNGAENNEEKYRIRLSEIQIGKANFKNAIIVTAHNNTSNGNRMGTPLFKYGTVTLDYLHNKFYLEPFQQQNDLNEVSWPISPMFIGGKLIVGIVWEKLKEKIKPGTAIIAIDDVPCDNFDLCYLINQKPLLSGKQKATLTLKDADGKVSKLEIAKD